MKKFIIVLQFELTNYFKNKSYMLTTIVVAVLLSALLFLPNIIDISGLFGTGTKKITSSEQEEIKDTKTSEEEKLTKYTIYDEAGIMGDLALLKETFQGSEWNVVSSAEEVKKLVENKEVKMGFVVKSYQNYDYYVYNKNMYDSNNDKFKSVLSTLNKQTYCEENQLDFAAIESVFSQPVQWTETVLGKDMMQSYWYCYGLVIIVFMIIIFYGVMIATSITAEKSNRSIEVLVTSVDANCLIFGKVIAGAIASIFQAGVILGGVLLAYQINIEAWGHMLDMVLNIPVNVLITFAFFGTGGYLFYAFLYAIVGALISKTEDINKTAAPVQLLIMIVYLAVLVQLQNVNGIVIKIASFLPFSSYSAMFARVAMGNVAIWEVTLSFLILVISIIGVGMLGAKFYRMGTLRYGNPIKFKNALKSLRQK